MLGIARAGHGSALFIKAQEPVGIVMAETEAQPAGAIGAIDPVNDSNPHQVGPITPS